MSETLLELNKLTKTFGNKKAVRGLSLKLHAGEIYGFLGPNGSGKTTTIRMIMDFIRPTSGAVTLFGGKGANQLAEKKQDIGYLSADASLYPEWNAIRHIKYVESLRDVKSNGLALAKRFDLKLNTKYKHLSSGNQQKLGIILATMHNPKLLILDEPTRGLDPIWQEEFYDILKNFQQQGGAVFMSSHNLSEVQKICDHVGIIKDGKLVASETMDSLRKIHTHQIMVQFKETVDIEAFRKIKHTEIIKSTPNSIIVNVTGDLNNLMLEITKHQLHDLEVTHASVEETFLRHYR
jgi:ABC-2 type transport system ATP-binding protein